MALFVIVQIKHTKSWGSGGWVSSGLAFVPLAAYGDAPESLLLLEAVEPLPRRVDLINGVGVGILLRGPSPSSGPACQPSASSSPHPR